MNGCPKCKKSPNLVTLVRIHVRSVHEKLRPFKCTECLYSATQRSHLKTHIKGVHEKSKQFKCTECPFATSHKHHLKLHTQAFHVKIKNFKCDACDYSAYRHDHLRLNPNLSKRRSEVQRYFPLLSKGSLVSVVPREHLCRVASQESISADNVLKMLSKHDRRREGESQN